MTAIQTRIPVSGQQRLYCAPETSDAFSPRFIIPRALRVSGEIDVVALQGALDDVVVRHEALRTTVARDAQPLYQQVHPPLPVPLTVADLPAGRPRQQAVEELLAEVETSSLPVERLPLLRASLTRFDDHDSVLGLVTHHSATDAWSMNLVTRDLAAYYAARIGNRPVELPGAPQYQDYTRWQLENASAPAMMANLAYWQHKLDGARMFALPTDRPIPAAYTAAYVRYPFAIDDDVATAVTRLGKVERFSGFMVMLAVLNVLAHSIDGTLDPAISTMFHGRSQPQFRDTVGMFLNFPTMRTNLAECRSFRDVLAGTRATCLQAYKHEVLHHQILDAIPTLAQPLVDPSNSYFVFGYWDASVASTAGEPYQLGQNATIIRAETRISQTLPGGVAWMVGAAPSGRMGGGVQYSPEIFDENTVAGWVSTYCRMLANAMTDPDRDWRQL